VREWLAPVPIPFGCVHRWKTSSFLTLPSLVSRWSANLTLPDYGRVARRRFANSCETGSQASMGNQFAGLLQLRVLRLGLLQDGDVGVGVYVRANHRKFSTSIRLLPT